MVASEMTDCGRANVNSMKPQTPTEISGHTIKTGFNHLFSILGDMR